MMPKLDGYFGDELSRANKFKRKNPFLLSKIITIYRYFWKCFFLPCNMTTEIDFILRLQISIFCVGSISTKIMRYVSFNWYAPDKQDSRQGFIQSVVSQVLTTGNNINNSISGNVLNTEHPLLAIDVAVSAMIVGSMTMTVYWGYCCPISLFYAGSHLAWFCVSSTFMTKPTLF